MLFVRSLNNWKKKSQKIDGNWGIWNCILDKPFALCTNKSLVASIYESKTFLNVTIINIEKFCHLLCGLVSKNLLDAYASYFFKVMKLYISFDLTAHNWQKWKRVFLTCPCHKIYRGEAVGLESCKHTWKLRFMWICGIWGNFVKIWYFVNNCLIEARIWKFFCTCVTHIIVIIWSTAHFVST